LHDRAFDRGFITITPEYRTKLATKLEEYTDEASLSLLHRYNNVMVNLPDKFAPDKKFLVYHNEYVFLK
jgi:putative restriction endonuclease